MSDNKKPDKPVPSRMQNLLDMLRGRTRGDETQRQAEPSPKEQQRREATLAKTHRLAAAIRSGSDAADSDNSSEAAKRNEQEED